jgi:DNA-3-methyladenine glycosylase II
MPVEVRTEVRPAWPLRLPPAGRDGVLRRRGAVLERLLHVEGEAVVVRAAQPAPSRIVLGAWAQGAEAAREALARMRRALGVDDDLRAFAERFRWDPLIGPSVRRTPGLRVARRPVAFEALAWAVCEQLIELERAQAIQRRIVRALGARCPDTGLRDVPGPAALAGCAPALLESFGLAGHRARALVRCAREVAAGRVDLDGADHERAWTRLRRLPGVGAWTVECLALHGQGRLDQVPAGDLSLRKLVGRLRSGGDPAARVEEDEVRAFFAPYAPWGGLAAAHALRAPGGAAGADPYGPSPGRNSFVYARSTTRGSGRSPLSAIHRA